MNWKSVALVLSGVVLGCAGGTAATTVAHAYAPKSPRFEHMCMGPSGSVDGINEDVRDASAQGWELAAMWQGIVCFKRPL